MEILDSILSIDPNYIVIGLLAFFFILELILENPFKFENRGRHLIENLILLGLLVLFNLFCLSLQISVIEWLNTNKFGLLYFVKLPIVLKLVVSVMLYDFTTYWIHRASHEVPILWRLHRVHHSDTQMDSSTKLRFHPLELILVYQTGNVLTAALFGTDVFSMAVYYFIVYIFFFFEHSNLHYPKWINKTLGLVFVMPDHHRVHHHQEQSYTDSNFADIFILWDRVFGTYKFLPTQNLQYGLQEFEDKKRQSLLFLLKNPFLTLKRESE